MIRIQIGCLVCGQLIDGTFAARSIEHMVAAYNQAHLYAECLKEKDDGQDEAEPDPESEDGPEAQDGDGDVDAAGRLH